MLVTFIASGRVKWEIPPSHEVHLYSHLYSSQRTCCRLSSLLNSLYLELFVLLKEDIHSGYIDKLSESKRRPKQPPHTQWAQLHEINAGLMDAELMSMTFCNIWPWFSFHLCCCKSNKKNTPWIFINLFCSKAETAKKEANVLYLNIDCALRKLQ